MAGRPPSGDGGLIAFLERTTLITLWKEREMRALDTTVRHLMLGYRKQASYGRFSAGGGSYDHEPPASTF